jgi:HlyD family secretion protein
LEIRVREGDVVQAGDVIAILDDDQMRARQDQAKSALAAAEARATSSKAQVAVLQEQLKQSELTADQSKDDSQGRVRQADADLTAAEADLSQQEASLKLALFDKEAYSRLLKTGAVSERQGRLTVSTADQQEAAVASAKRRVEAARGALTTARANLANPGIRLAQVAGVRQQIIQQESEIASSEASAQQAKYQLAEADANRDDLTVKAPFSGTVITRAAEPGEVVTAGTAIVTLLDLSKVYLRGFVPEGEIGKVKIGQPARIYLDSSTQQPIDAYVSRIDPQATFTPENTYFRDDRVKQVVGVKLQLKSGFGYAKPGMPSDGEILVQGDQWPKHKVGK